MENPEPLSYNDFVSLLNEGKISFMRFSIEGYGHYRNCSIQCDHGDPRNPKLSCISFFLTQDGSEKAIFYGPFKENVKIFHMGKEGRMTLRLLWKRVKILELVYKE